MDQQPPNYHVEFLRSPQHAVLALVTLGLGFLSASVLGIIAGVTAYGLGWIYLPDLPFFRRAIDKRQDAAKQAEEAKKVAEFVQRRDALIRTLSPERKERYSRLILVCRDIENASRDNPLATSDAGSDPRLRKLDELMWTFLRLLGIEESLEQFLATDRCENIPEMVKTGEEEVTRLKAEVEGLKSKGDGALLETRQRYLGSRQERLEVLRKRLQRSQQAEANLALVVSEQDRLEQQIKLIRADAVATKNAETLTARIDATVEHLDQTNKWLAEMDEFKDMVGDMPPTEARVGYAPALAAPPPVPPVIDPMQVRRRGAVRRSES